MKLYQRNIYGKLNFLRFISFAGALICFLSFKDGHTNTGYFLAVMLVFLSLISIKDLIIYNDRFKVKQFCFFGLLPIVRTFEKKDHVKLEGYGSDFGKRDEEGVSDLESPAGCMFYFYALIFGTKSRITHRKFMIHKKNDSNSFNKTEMFLSKEEYDLLNDILK